MMPLIITMVSAIMIGRSIHPRYGDIAGLCTVFLLQFVLRAIPRDHRSGIAQVRKLHFTEATSSFQRSLQFFDRHPWLDEYRSVFLLSPSAISYREMALANLGFSYAQLKDGANARKWYSVCIERYPESGIALSALNMMDCVEVRPQE